MNYALRLITLLSSLLFLNACSIYNSPDRKKFETEQASYNLSSLSQKSCSESSLSPFANSSHLIDVKEDTNGDSVFLWKHNIDDTSYLETDNLKGVYCLYEN